MTLEFSGFNGSAPARFAARSVLLDLDGTLFDTFPLHWQACNVALSAIGIADPITWDEYVSMSIREGRKVVESRPNIPASDFYREKDKAFLELVSQHLAPRPGVNEFMESMRKARMPFALVTTARRPSVESLLSKAWKMDLPVAIVTFDDLELTKPAPDPYLAACRMLGVPASTCVAIEDSPLGCESALAAGATCLVVQSEYFSAKEFPDGAVHIGCFARISLGDAWT